MYWGDADKNVIERANLDGTDRRFVLSEAANSLYFGFHLDAGFIYITDWNYKYPNYLCV